MKIKLRSRNHHGMYAEIDEEDYPKLKNYKWRVFKTRTKSRDNFYAQTDIKKNGKWTTVYMHRLIMDEPKIPYVVDHINRNGLDNRRENLRVVSYQKNRFNNSEIINNPGKKYGDRVNRRVVNSYTDKHIHTNLFELAKSLNTTVSKIVEKSILEYLERYYPECLEKKE